MRANHQLESLVCNAIKCTRVQELGVRSWGTWGCEASKFPWTYDANEVGLKATGE